MTRSDSWTRVGSVAPAALRDATIQLHWAAQVLAAAGQTFAEAQDDDSHLAMMWDADRGELVGAPFGGAYPFRVALHVQDITLRFLDRTAEPLGSLPLAGKTMADAYEWLQTGLANYMGRLTQIDKPGWEMPEHAVGRGERQVSVADSGPLAILPVDEDLRRCVVGQRGVLFGGIDLLGGLTRQVLLRLDVIHRQDLGQ